MCSIHCLVNTQEIPEGAIISEDWQTTTLKDALWTKIAEKDVSKAGQSAVKNNLTN